MAGGYVYAIGMEGTNFVKIGRGQNAAKRVATMQTGSPYTLTLLYEVWTDHPKRVEKRLHQLLDACRYRGEWFALEDRNIEACFAEGMILAEQEDREEVVQQPIAVISRCSTGSASGRTSLIGALISA